MNNVSDAPASVIPHDRLHFIDGTDSHRSYLVIARRGGILLAVKFSGLTDGARLGVPGTTYLHARLRSARVADIIAQLDAAAGMGNVLHLSDQQLGLDEAWPALAFEKVDHQRASLAIGAFIRGSLIADTAAVVARIDESRIFRKLIDYTVERTGPAICLVDAEAASSWLLSQAKPMMTRLRRAAMRREAMHAAQKEFKAAVAGKFEIVEAHLGQLATIHDKHVHLWAGEQGEDQGGEQG